MRCEPNQPAIALLKLGDPWEMGGKLLLDRDIVTLNGRLLKVVSHTVDGKIVLQGVKFRTIVIADENGYVDGKEYAVNRESLVPRSFGVKPLPALHNGQTIYCFRFSRRSTCLFRATFVGHLQNYAKQCKIVPETPISGREVMKVARPQVFESLEEAINWHAKLVRELQGLGGIVMTAVDSGGSLAGPP
jgi:hypothetical protein